MTILIEACVDSVESAQAAIAAGAQRIELCGDGDGGTTPPVDVMRACCAVVSVPVHVMIRPRPGNFVYTDDELADMLTAIEEAKQAGAHGVVLGPLGRTGRIARPELAMLVAAARPMSVVFHRAFDHTPDAEAALDQLLELGVDGVLTSGHANTAAQGTHSLAKLVRRANNRLAIIAGGGVRGHNVRELVHESGVRAVHARATDARVISAIAAVLAEQT